MLTRDPTVRDDIHFTQEEENEHPEATMDHAHDGKDGRRREPLLLPVSMTGVMRDEEKRTITGKLQLHPAFYVAYVNQLIKGKILRGGPPD